MKKLLWLVALVVFAVVLVPSPVRAGAQDFTLVNKTGVEIHNLYVSPNGKDDWEEDVLGEDTLSPGESVTIKFSGHSDCLWDLMVKDKGGSTLTWKKINLCEVSKVVLHYDGKEAWATFE